MKIRIGFVSNSSSSSFVISIPKEMENRPLPFYIKVDGDLKDHTNWTIHNGRELSDYISEYNLDSEGERVCAMRKAIENGRVVLVEPARSQKKRFPSPTVPGISGLGC